MSVQSKTVHVDTDVIAWPALTPVYNTSFFIYLANTFAASTIFYQLSYSHIIT